MLKKAIIQSKLPDGKAYILRPPPGMYMLETWTVLAVDSNTVWFK